MNRTRGGIRRRTRVKKSTHERDKVMEMTRMMRVIKKMMKVETEVNSVQGAKNEEATR